MILSSFYKYAGNWYLGNILKKNYMQEIDINEFSTSMDFNQRI